MLKGMLVVNAFLKKTKFDDLYQTLLEASKAAGFQLDVCTNAELCCRIGTSAFAHTDYAFTLFWDKDVQLAMQLEALGMPVFNSAQSILQCDDKALTYLALTGAEIATPQTILAPKTFANIGYTSLDFLDEAAQVLGFPMVVKECFGSFGQQVYLADNMSTLRQLVQKLGGLPILFQKLIVESYGRDVRINVVGNRVIASILRKSVDGDFRSNLTRGGAMERYTPTPEQSEIALRAVKCLGLDFAGVDVLFGADGPIVCEVNSNAHFKTTLECTGVNMAEEIMRHIAGKLAKA